MWVRLLKKRTYLEAVSHHLRILKEAGILKMRKGVMEQLPDRSGEK